MVEGGRPARRSSLWADTAPAGTLVRAGGAYWLRLRPRVLRELVRWDRLARRIPDPLLREQAMAKLAGERLNPEAAALFAILAPPRRRAKVVSLIVAYQVLYDYLDGVNEQPGFDGLSDGLRLHGALRDAVLPQRPLVDYYAGHPEADDGGYLRALCAWCRRLVVETCDVETVGETLAAATERCGAAQSHNHAIAVQGEPALVDWSRRQAIGDYLWWELAAGGISCLNIHAALACAADPRAGVDEVARVEAAYFPSICSLSALLDSLADYHADGESGNHSFARHYRDAEQAAERLTRIAQEAQAGVAELRHGHRHAVILAGIVAYYLSSPTVWEGFPAPAAERLIACVGPLGASMCSVMRARRRAHRRAERGSARPPDLAVSPVPAAPGQGARARRSDPERPAARASRL